MAFDAYDDYEQSERVQQWLRQNGVSILVGIVLGLVLIFGWRRWREHQETHRAEAATQFEQVQQAYAAGRNSDGDKLVDALVKDYADTAYAPFASGLRAAQQVKDGKLADAATSLTWARDHAKGEDGALKNLFALRLARVQLAEGKADDAVSTLQAVPSTTYAAVVAELRGDALVKLGRDDEARKAYQAALAAMDADAPQKASVQVKLDNLAKAGKQGA